MKETAVKTEYHIHRFMYDLGIKNSALAVYAALYSFTIGERGLFHGSQKYLADSLSISVRTLQTVLKNLLSLGLIEKYSTEDGRYTGVRCVSLIEVEKRKKAEKEQLSRPSEAQQSFAAELKKRVDERKAEEEREKENKKKSLDEHLRRVDELCARIDSKLHGRNMPDHEKNTFLMMSKYEKPGDNRRFLSFGKSGGVIMTEPQYRRLLELLPTEELMPYFVKLELMLDENVKTGKKPPHSHYKTIKKWIEEDTAV